MAKQTGPKIIKPPAGTKLPVVKCPYGCLTGVAGWAWTWTTNKKGSLVYIEHPVCNGCGTSSIKILKGKRPQATEVVA